MATKQATLQLPKKAWTFSSGPYRALDFSFRLRTNHAAMGRYLEQVFRPLAASGGRAKHTYSLIDYGEDGEDGEDRFVVLLDDEEILRTSMIRYPIAYVIWHVNQETVKASSSAILLHAAAAEKDGVGVILAAAMESGKTTLVGGLVRAGFRYLTDEAVAIDPASGVIRPFPKSLAVDEGSWEVLPEFEPTVEDDVESYVNKQWQVDPTRLRPDIVAPPTRPGLIVLPKYEEGAETRLEPLSRGAAVVALVENSFNFVDHGRAGLERLADVVRGCDCYRLTVGDLDRACDLVIKALQHRGETSGGETP